jgi:hypothetical protein
MAPWCKPVDTYIYNKLIHSEFIIQGKELCKEMLAKIERMAPWCKPVDTYIYNKLIHSEFIRRTFY